MAGCASYIGIQITFSVFAAVKYEKGTIGLGNLGAFTFLLESNSTPPTSAKYKYGTPVSAQVIARPFLCQALFPAGSALQYSTANNSSSLKFSCNCVIYESAASLNGAPCFDNSLFILIPQRSCPANNSTFIVFLAVLSKYEGK